MSQMPPESQGDHCKRYCPIRRPPPGLRGLAGRTARALGGGFTSLKHGNYRLYMGGHLVSMIGAWAHRTAMSWLIYEMTGSQAMLGYLGAIGAAPITLLSFLGGVTAERFERRKIIIATQLLSMIGPIALAVGVLVSLPSVRPWHILAATLLHGLVMAFDIPARQSFVVQMVGPRDLPNAVALSAMVFNSARAIGPAVGAGIYWFFDTYFGHLGGGVGAGACFGINAATYLCLVGALVVMRLPQMDARGRREARLSRHPWGGFYYVLSRPRMAATMVLLMGLSIFGWSLLHIMAAVAKEDFGQRIGGFGGLLSCYGLGALAAGLMMAYLSRTRRRRRLILIGAWTAVASLAALAAAAMTPEPPYWLALVLIALLGLGNVMAMIGASGYIQLIVSERFRGRVMGVYTFCFVGMMPFGALLIGWMAEALGSNGAALLVDAAVLAAIVTGVALRWRRLDRRGPA